ncbi:MAG: hypothetical protein U0821_27770 [Chloroflexota bacterium]
MSSERTPRVCIVTRPTPYELLRREHGTAGQAAFFLRSRGQDVAVTAKADAGFHGVLEEVWAAVPPSWRRAEVHRADLDRFLFAPDDVVVCVGQDGLVANVAKYLDGQIVVGINPDPSRYDGVLARHSSADARGLIESAGLGRPAVEERTLVECTLDDGQTLRALNEIFLGHRGHQSARYTISWRGSAERHSSSGVICGTGTGATGWCRSIARERRDAPEPPGPTEPALVFFVREAFPSVSTQTALTAGVLEPGEALTVVSEMDNDGVIFGDGIEEDRLAFGYGVVATVRASAARLRLAI